MRLVVLAGGVWRLRSFLSWLGGTGTLATTPQSYPVLSTNAAEVFNDANPPRPWFPHGTGSDFFFASANRAGFSSPHDSRTLGIEAFKFFETGDRRVGFLRDQCDGKCNPSNRNRASLFLSDPTLRCSWPWLFLVTPTQR